MVIVTGNIPDNTSMLTGAMSPCTYPASSQLAAALAFIRAHRSAVVLIAINIGANNVAGCAAGGAINRASVTQGLAAAQSDLPKILGALRAAAGEDTVIAGMNLTSCSRPNTWPDRRRRPWRHKSVSLGAAALR
jgi:hypothetical protein